MTESLLYIITALLLLIVFLQMRKKEDNSSHLLKDGLKLNSEAITGFRKELSDETRQNRTEAQEASKNLRQEVEKSINEYGASQSRLLKDLGEKVDTLTEKNEEKIANLGKAVEKQLNDIRQDNTTQLEKMRETVDEKLQKTLESRLGDAFKQVSNLLESVHKDMGEMKNLATGVGDLKKVLTNVKTKGILGEYQLENILEQMLSAHQYEKEIPTKKNSRDRVEFAVRFPGRSDNNEPLWLPIDSKFPLEPYSNLLDAYEKGDLSGIESSSKLLHSNIKKYAKDIFDKYVDPPNTTDFAIMFVPIEGLYAELLRNNTLFDLLQKEYKITIVGPTNLAAFLSSLYMGFRTLAIEKRSSEVWNVLGDVKKEFGKFGDILVKAKKNIQQADKNIEELIGTRTNAINRKLRDVEVAGEDYDLFEQDEPAKLIE